MNLQPSLALVWLFLGLLTLLLGASGCSSEDFPLNPLDPSSVSSDGDSGVSCRGDDRARTAASSDYDDSGSESESAVSYTSSCSHNVGQQCTSCHVAGSGSEASEYAFTLAGSVYTNSTGDAALTNSTAVMKFYTDSTHSGSPVLTLQVDQSGNFYTTQAVPNNLYPVIENNNQRFSMSGFVDLTQPEQRSCASCHGSTTLNNAPPVIYAPN